MQTGNETATSKDLQKEHQQGRWSFVEMPVDPAAVRAVDITPPENLHPMNAQALFDLELGVPDETAHGMRDAPDAKGIVQGIREEMALA